MFPFLLWFPLGIVVLFYHAKFVKPELSLSASHICIFVCFHYASISLFFIFHISSLSLSLALIHFHWLLPPISLINSVSRLCWSLFPSCISSPLIKSQSSLSSSSSRCNIVFTWLLGCCRAQECFFPLLPACKTCLKSFLPNNETPSQCLVRSDMVYDESQLVKSCSLWLYIVQRVLWQLMFNLVIFLFLLLNQHEVVPAEKICFPSNLRLLIITSWPLFCSLFYR